jgi:4-hydroxybenzoate polyprenyltransferase
MRDVLGDKISGIRTLPVILGEKNTARILMCCDGFLLLLSPLTWAPKLALAMVVYMGLYIPYFSSRRGLLARDILVENNWLIVLGVFYLIT